MLPKGIFQGIHLFILFVFTLIDETLMFKFSNSPSKLPKEIMRVLTQRLDTSQLGIKVKC